jgi:3-deoxy-manno-octulosonate cytidylyltransferase (CMP-KDO synthetase)
MKVHIGIPARMGSSRFPGKPLKKILGKSMIEHVYRRSMLAKNIDSVFVATCDTEIMDTVRKFGGNSYMTDKDIMRPGLRVASACEQINMNDDDIVVVVQGDEPLLHPEMIDIAVKPLIEDKNIQLLTLIANANETEWKDKNEVKVTIDKNDDILMMSRSPIPSNYWDIVGPRYKQVAIMPFRKKFLIDFQLMEPTSLELAEQIELMRAVESCIKVRTSISNFINVSVDTKADLLEAESVMIKDPIFKLYKDE